MMKAREIGHIAEGVAENALLATGNSALDRKKDIDVFANAAPASISRNFLIIKPEVFEMSLVPDRSSADGTGWCMYMLIFLILFFSRRQKCLEYAKVQAQ